MDVEATPRDRAPRRVLMTCDTVGGAWRYALELSRELCARGHVVALAALGPAPSRAQRAAAAAVDGLALHARTCRLVWMDEPWGDVAAVGEWLLALAGSFRPDVVHANDFGHVALPWPAPVLTVAHACVASWWRAVHGAAAPADWDRYRGHVRTALGASDAVVAPSRAMAEALRAEYGLVSRELHVLPNGLCPPVPITVSRRQPVVLATGRLWDDAKNLGRLAAVAPCVPWPVCLAGPMRGPAGNSASLLNVRHLGVLRPAAMRRWYARAAIYALPARYAPSGLSILEAAQHGCALVLGDIGSLREIWDGAALFVAPDDGDALRDALLRMIGDDALRERLAARARRRALFMTAARMADAYIDLYGQLAAARSGHAVARTRTPQPNPSDTMVRRSELRL